MRQEVRGEPTLDIFHLPFSTSLVISHLTIKNSGEEVSGATTRKPRFCVKKRSQAVTGSEMKGKLHHWGIKANYQTIMVLCWDNFSHGGGHFWVYMSILPCYLGN